MQTIHLIVVEGAETGKGLRVDRDRDVSIGRDQGNDLVLQDGRVSRAHARLEVRGGLLEVVDLGSSNGVEVNGRAVAGRASVAPGDTIRIGDHAIRVAVGDAGEAPPLGGDFGLSGPRRPVDVTAPMPAPPRPADFVGRTVGAYRVGEPAGEDPESLLFDAVSTGPEGTAVRVLKAPLGSSADEEAFLACVRPARNLDHPNVVRVLEVGVAGGRAWIVEERVRGTDLATRLEMEASLDPARIVEWVEAAARAVESAHAAGVLHLGLSPSRCRIDDFSGDLRLGGFGLARAFDRLGLRPDSPGRPAEVLAFAAPESLLDPGSMDARTDVYGLGAILHTLLARRPPFPGTDRMQLVHAVLAMEPAALAPGVPAFLARAAARALGKDPAGRFPDASAFRAALRSG